ncbi:MAG TPA: PVC-type heme-binding CxxCH protein [Tepidisphaeraceae bacterium]
MAAVIGVTGPARAQKSPEETRQAMQVGEGLDVSVFASEPMFANPCDMDVDSKGRVWVTEGWNYRSSMLRPKEGDRILFIEDTDGDGKADKATTFYQGTDVNSALGICVLGNKVIVSCAPNVFLFTDEDGDGKADKKQVLFSGIKGVQHDHAVHAFNFGPDGKLYFNMGNAGEQLMDKDGKPVVDMAGNKIDNHGRPYRQGMVFRMNPDGSEIETLAWNFRNNYEVAVDSFGTLWQSDNDDDGNRGVRINYVMEFGNHGYTDENTGEYWQPGWERARARGASETDKVFWEWHQYDPGVVPNLLHTGQGSPTGMCIYEGKLLPKVFWGQMIHADAGPNVVRSYPVQPDGAGYKADMVNILQGGSDKWFRPSDVCVAPDGSLMVADWYDPGVGGHATGDKDLKKGVKGRVYRVAPPNTPYKVPALDLSSAAGACAALANPNNATRYLAWTKLHEMQQAAEPELLKMWQDHGEPRLRARALHLLARIKGSEEKYVKEAISDQDADIRITGLRIARELKMDLPAIVKQLVKDPSPQVRRDCAIALRGGKSPEAVELWAELAAQHTAGDRWETEALGIGASGKDEACFEAYLKRVGADGWNTPAGHDIVWRIRSERCAPLLAKIILDPATPPEQLWHYFRALDFIKGPAKSDAIMAALTGANGNRTIIVESLTRTKDLDPAKQAQVREMAGKLLDGVKGTGEFVQLCEQMDVHDRGPELLAYAAAHPTDVWAGTAIRLVIKNQPKALEDALKGADSAKLTAALGASTDRSVIKLLEGAAADAKRDLAVRQAAVTALTHTRQGSRALLDLAKKQQLGADLTPLAASLLHNSAQRDVRDEAARLLPLPQAKGSEKLPPIERLVAMKGNAEHGKAVFVSATCSTCHIINGQGTSFGPELSEIGAKLPKEALYTSILYPSAGISFGYEGWILSTKEGDDLDGMIANESADQIVLRRAGGVNTPVKKSEIKERRQMKLSIMPENLQQQMTTQDLVDLVEYLGTLKKAQQAAK